MIGRTINEDRGRASTLKKKKKKDSLFFNSGRKVAKTIHYLPFLSFAGYLQNFFGFYLLISLNQL